MSVWAKAWAYEQRCGSERISGKHEGSYKGNPTAKAVLVAIAEFANESGECWASQETLSEMCDCEVRTVRSQLENLESLEFIERSKRRRKDGTRTSDIITLKAPKHRLRPSGEARQPEKFSAGQDQPENDDTSTGKPLQDNRKTTTDQPEKFSGPIENEPSLNEEPSVSPRGDAAPERVPEDGRTASDEKPAKAMTTMTIERTREVGFDPAAHQKQAWGSGWAKFIYVGEGEDSPSAEQQFAVLNEIVAAAAGKLGTHRFFLAVDDAVQRVENERGKRGGAHQSGSGERDELPMYWWVKTV